MHEPVLLEAVLEWLCPQPGEVILDGTLGSGGHAAALLERVGPRGRLIGIDRDQAAVDRAREQLQPYHSQLSLHHSNFSYFEMILQALNVTHIDKVCIDLGVSNDQLRTAERGFSFVQEGPLDMRMDREEAETAEHLVNTLTERELADIIYEYGEERYARRIAKRIVNERRRMPFITTTQLARAIVTALPRRYGPTRIHPATRTFLALRICVNQELTSLEHFLARIPQWIRPGGRIAVIAFHSLEDRLVKRAFREEEQRGVFRRLTKKPVCPSQEEISRNPQARSAKLRVAEKVVTT